MGKPSVNSVPTGSSNMPGTKTQSAQAIAAEHEVLLDGTLLPTPFRTQSYQIAKDICNYIVRREDADPAPNKSCSIMRSLVDDQLKESLEMFHSLADRLELKERDQLVLINDIATNMFDDQIVSWGRIVTLHAFCGYLSRYCEESRFPDCADDIARILGSIIVNRLGLWMVTNGGWHAFEKQFPSVWVFEVNGVWKAIVILGLLVGAVLVFYSSVRFMSGASFL